MYVTAFIYLELTSLWLQFRPISYQRRSDTSDVIYVTVSDLL